MRSNKALFAAIRLRILDPPSGPEPWSVTALRNAGSAATCALLALAGRARGGERA